jgi:hypothetical protein
MAVVAIVVFVAIFLLSAIGNFVTPEHRHETFAPAAVSGE